MEKYEPNKIFKARYKFYAYISLLVVFLTFFIASIMLIKDYSIIATEIYITIILLIILIFMISFSILFLILILTYHTLRYEFKEEYLLLIYGFFEDKIYYKDIVSWEKKDLEFNPLTSLRMPGIALFNCYFANEGKVRMFATSMGSKVLLIYTKKENME